MQIEMPAVTPMPWARRAPALGIAAVVLLAASFPFAAGGPGSTDGDAKIAAWYESSSHQHTQMLGFVGFVLGGLCLIGFLATLRERLASVERAPATMGQLAFGAGVASAALTMLAIGLFAVPAFLAFDTSAAEIVPSTYRMFYTAAYVAWVAGGMVGALTVAATTAVAFRSGVLPRWLTWLGVVVGVAQLLSFFFVPEFAFWGWVAIASIVLLRRAPGAVGAARA